MSVSDDEIRVVQQNMNGSRIISIQLLDNCRATRIYVLLLQEMPLEGRRIYGLETGGVRTINSFVGGPCMASIVFLNEDVKVLTMEGPMDRFFALASVRKGSGKRRTSSIISRPCILFIIWSPMERARRRWHRAG